MISAARRKPVLAILAATVALTLGPGAFAQPMERETPRPSLGLTGRTLSTVVLDQRLKAMEREIDALRGQVSALEQQASARQAQLDALEMQYAHHWHRFDRMIMPNQQPKSACSESDRRCWWIDNSHQWGLAFHWELSNPEGYLKTEGPER